MFDCAAILAFDALAQSALEAQFPAEIQLPGTPVLACAGGNLRHTDLQAIAGGMLGEFDLLFRIRKTLLDRLPELGTPLQWRRAGETTWRGTASLIRASDPSDRVAFLLYAGNPNS